MSQYIVRIRSKHEGRHHVRLVEDSFTVTGPFGEHLALVFKPLREPLGVLGRHIGAVGLEPPVLKPILRLILKALDFLHSECHIIHTGKLLRKMHERVID